MKKLLLALLVLATSSFAHAQTVTMDFTVGVLTNQLGATMPNGGLFQVIASSDAVFDSPTPESFVGGNDILVYSGTFDSATTGVDGAAAFLVSDVLLSQFPIAQANLLVRWFPSLTTNSINPGYATFYGQFGVMNDPTWVAPAAGGALSYSMLTLSAGGALAEAVGQAALQTAVPEPATYGAIIGALALGFVAYRRRQLAA